MQSAWLKASRADSETLKTSSNLTGWFTTITAHEAFDQLGRANGAPSDRWATPKNWTGWPWPATAPADEDALLADSVGSALLVVLDRLSPAQRVAFVLHDVFAMPFETIADMLDRSPAAAKKLASRARGRLRHACDPAEQPRRAGPARPSTSRSSRRFWRRPAAATSPPCSSCWPPTWCAGSIGRLVPDDVPTELRGAREVAEETRRFTQRARAGVVLLIDGVPGIVIAPRGRAQALLRIGVGADNRIHTIDITGDADRLRRGRSHAAALAVSAITTGPSGTKDIRTSRRAVGNGPRSGARCSISRSDGAACCGAPVRSPRRHWRRGPPAALPTTTTR